jgi:hypothetical protein
MGEVELHLANHTLIIHSIFYFYGDASSYDLANQVATDISTHWNEPKGWVMIDNRRVEVRFHIEGKYEPSLAPETVWYNTDRRNNYFRIEEFSQNHISFVDDIGCNTGYFKLDNLLHNSTTAAHEFGHTLGLDHPSNLDLRGYGQPGIMYPRGTVCDPLFQYDLHALPLQPGGTLDPFKRKVLQQDIENLKLGRLAFDTLKRAKLGDFSSVYHQKH